MPKAPLATGTVVAVHIRRSGILMAERLDELVLDHSGPVGDAHYGVTMKSDIRQRWLYPEDTEIRNQRQVSIVDLDELQAIASNLGIETLEPGTIADNICTTGIENLTAMPLMSRLVFAHHEDPKQDGAVVVLGGENIPCTLAGEMVAERYGTLPQKFPKASFHLRGVTGWVERPGVVRPGAALRVEAPRPAS